jgi:hypothetical protein
MGSACTTCLLRSGLVDDAVLNDAVPDNTQTLDLGAHDVADP